MGYNTRTGGPIKVLLADDHTMFRQGLAGILASYGGLEVVAEVPNDEEAIGLAQQLRPDVVVMQVQMPFERAKGSLERMRSFEPPPKVIVVTMFEEPRYVCELMGLGASAYLVKSASSEHLVAAVRAAVLDPESRNVVVGMSRGMLEGAQEGVDRSEEHTSELQSRQYLVCRLLLEKKKTNTSHVHLYKLITYHH